MDNIKNELNEKLLSNEPQKKRKSSQIQSKSEETLTKLFIVSVLCLIFMVIEFIGGYIAGSIAIMSDAAHLFSDFLGFIISILSIYISRQEASKSMSFGYHRSEVIGALVSVNIIWGLTIWLFSESTYRIFNPKPVNALIMIITGILGLIFNIIMGLVLMYYGIDHTLHNHGHSHDDDHSHGHDQRHDHGHSHLQTVQNTTEESKDQISPNEEHGHNHDHAHDKENKDMNINLKASLIHILGDVIQNIGVIFAALIIYFFPDLTIFDPLCTYVFSIIVLFTTFRIVKECLLILMEGSPEMNLEELKNDLLKINGVKDVHDLHVWSLSQGKVSFSCHLISDLPQVSLKKAKRMLLKKYQIQHATIQVEGILDEDGEKETCSPHDMH